MSVTDSKVKEFCTRLIMNGFEARKGRLLERPIKFL